MFSFFSKKERVLRIERNLAGKKAKLAITKEIASKAETIPGQLVSNMMSLSEEIAKLECLLTQLKKQ